MGSVPTPSPPRVDKGGFSRRYPTRDVQLWKGQHIGIEALEAMLMDDEFREIHSSESGLNTCNHRFKISISSQVRLAGCSIIMLDQFCFQWEKEVNR
uniref:Uncharacterized protein n=1 Tax=Populus trichocarpa TaxID=3694 RepID=A0A2K1Y820_POPTR